MTKIASKEPKTHLTSYLKIKGTFHQSLKNQIPLTLQTKIHKSNAKKKKKNLENQKREKPQSQTKSPRRRRKNGTEIIKEGNKNMIEKH